MRPHPFLKFVRPIMLVGGLVAISGALIASGRIEIANGGLVGAIVLGTGVALILFGILTNLAWRILVAANDSNNTAQTEEQE